MDHLVDAPLNVRNSKELTFPKETLTGNPTFTGNPTIRGDLTIRGNLAVQGTANLNHVKLSGPLWLTGTANEIYFQDGGQIRSLDNNHRILFRRPENKLEIREYGDIVFSPGATSGSETAKAVLLANGNLGIGTATPGEKLEVNGNVRAKGFFGDGSRLRGIPGVAWSGIVAEDVDVRTSAVNVGHVQIAPPAGMVYIVLRFNGTCIGSDGDQIVLAASNVSQQWTPKEGSVSLLFNSTRGLEQNFSHTSVCMLSPYHSETQNIFDYYAVAQNSGYTGGTGKVTIYGILTVEVFMIDYADF